ncbi:MAG: thermonuclease family protein [Patescibacteria group bacterium]
MENTAMVEYVIDGDTIIVEGGARIRLLGIDAREKGEGCYQEAKERLEELVLGKLVRLEKGQSDVDKYGRCLRFIFYEAQNISLELAREGFAKAAFYGQDFSYRQEILEAQKQAIENRAGCIYN